MKNIFKICLYTLLCVLLVSSAAYADGGAMQASWQGDYDEDMNLVIKFKSPALYNQQVTAVMYPADAEATIANFCRMTEVTSLSGTETTVTIPLANDLTAAGGAYKVKLQGNGVLSSASKEIIDVKIFTPYAATDMLGRINGATISTIAGILEDCDDHLQLSGTPTTDLLTTFLNIRDIDFGGAFPDLNEVKKAYEIADIIVYLLSESVTVDGICEKVEDNAEFLGIDTTDEDYTAYKQGVYAKIISIKNTYNTTGIKTFKLLAKAIKETVAVETINATTVSNMNDVVLKYKTTIGITDTYYNKFNSYSDENKDLVLRYIYNKNYTFVSSVKTDFEKGVDEVGTPGDGLGGDGLGSSDDDDSFSGGDASIGGGDSGEITPADKTGFNDVTASHWANEYVTKLSEDNILSGYPDGSFKPENTVTREEFVKMIVSAAGLYDANATGEFDDMSASHWAYKFVASAKNAGLVNGVTDTAFGAGKAITREDVAVITSRILDRFNDTDFTKQQEAETGFTDDADISGYSKGSIKALVQSGIINGFEDNSFKPKAYLTRAQAAKIIYLMRKALS